MPNAILRAGPFASSSNSFLNEPSPFDSNAIAAAAIGAIPGINPVNCANDTSSLTWLWRYNDVVNKVLTTHTGCEINIGGETIPVTSTSTSSNGLLKTATADFSISDSASSNNVTRMTTTLSFYYQAAQSFEIKVTYNGLATGDSTLYQADFMGFADSQTAGVPISGFPSISGSVTRTLPASVKPAFYYAALDTSSAIDFPADVCSPKTSIANTSATLSFEFL